MFTSRAEYRTLLRQDNADLRLTELSHKIGLASQQRMKTLSDKITSVAKAKQIINTLSVEPEEINGYLLSIGSAPIAEKQKVAKLLLRPDVGIISLTAALAKLSDHLHACSKEILEQTEIQIKYERYIEKEQDIVEKMAAMEERLIPDNFNYDRVAALSNEALQKFKRIRPRTLGQAGRISGVNPSDVQILMVYMGR
jgi:tRNA uridine 5-carboxymethylaminomethyl modification enzyme